MTYTEWYKKAAKLHKTCCEIQNLRNGSKRLTDSESHILNELQHAIGSHHAITNVTYNEARNSLDEMFTMVKSGTKCPPLFDDRK